MVKRLNEDLQDHIIRFDLNEQGSFIQKGVKKWHFLCITMTT